MPLIKNGAAPIAVKPEIKTAVTITPDDDSYAEATPDFVSVTNLQPDDMRAEQRRIQRSGLFQAALNSPALMQYAPTLEDYFALLHKAADEGLKYVNELGQGA